MFLEVIAPRGREFLEKEKALYSRPTNKSRLDVNRSVNELARLVASKEGQFPVRFTAGALFEFGTVGISDGVIIHR